MNLKFLRYCKVIFPDSDGGEDLYIEGGGLPNMARITFEVLQDKDSHYPFAEIKIFNLSEATENKIKLLEKTGQTIKLEAGYVGDSGLIFEGQIVHSSTKHFIDKESTFYAVHGRDILSKKCSISMNEGSSFGSILNEIQRQGKVKIENRSLIKNLEDSIWDESGYQAGTKLITHLNSVLDPYNIEWFYYNNKIYLFSRDVKKNTDNNTIEVDTGVNLIAADYSARERDFRDKYFKERIPTKKEADKPQLESDDIRLINISSLFEYEATIFKVVLFDKKRYAVKSVKFTGDTHGNGDNWKIDFELYDN